MDDPARAAMPNRDAGALATASFSRTRRATVVAFFSYVRFGLSVGGLLLIPLVIASVGGRAYGFWLASGEAAPPLTTASSEPPLSETTCA